MQRQVLVLLKAVKKAFLSDHDAISTYYLKNILFLECDEKEVDFWMKDNSTVCVLTLMDRAEECLRKRHLPHYVMANAYILQWTNLRGQLKLFLRWRKKSCRLWIFLKQFRRQCLDDEKDRLTSSLCQLFTEKYWGKITDEHAKNYKPVQQHITLVFTVFLSMVEDGGEILSAILSSHHTSESCNIISFCDSYISDLQCDSVLKRLNNTFESIHFESNEWLSLMQFAFAVVAGGVTLTRITKNYSLVNFFCERLLES